YDRVMKDRGHGMNAGDDPATASQIWTSPNYSTGSAKLTSTLTSRVLVEAGYSQNIERYNIVNQPGIDAQRGTPAWYANASRRDPALGTRWASLAQDLGQYPDATTSRDPARTSPAPITSRSARSGPGGSTGGRGSATVILSSVTRTVRRRP